MKLVTIASGSGGNCIYVESEHRRILIDAGISLKRIEAGLGKLSLSASDIDALLITHEHADHIGGLGVLLRKYSMPVYCTEGTYRAVMSMGALGRLPEDNFRWITTREPFTIGDMSIRALAVSHDAAEPVAYRISAGEKSIAVVTDLGTTCGMAEQLRGLSALVLEANHDERMLEAGPYPYTTKRRIKSDSGHLSNEAAGRLLADISWPGLSQVLLGHISRINNYDKLAYEGVRCEAAFGEKLPEISLAPEKELSKIIEV